MTEYRDGQRHRPARRSLPSLGGRAWVNLSVRGKGLDEADQRGAGLAAIEAGRLRLAPEPVAVADLAAETISLIRPLADQRGILLTGPDVAPSAHVLADRQRLKQVLLNHVVLPLDAAGGAMAAAAVGVVVHGHVVVAGRRGTAGLAGE